MNKRGQVTIFIILGIVIVVIFAAVLMVYSFYGKEKVTPEVAEKFISTQIEPIKDHVKGCVEETINKGVKLISIQGGYLEPVKYVQLGEVKVSYACHKDTSGANVNRLPSLEQIKKEIEFYTKKTDAEDAIDKCIADFKTFKDQGLKFKTGTKNIKIEDITLTSIILTIDYPITVSKGDYSTNIREISSDIPSSLGTVHKVANDIVNDEVKNKVFDIDSYIINNPPSAKIERQRNEDNLFYYLTSIPRSEEEPLKFHFVIEK